MFVNPDVIYPIFNVKRLYPTWTPIYNLRLGQPNKKSEGARSALIFALVYIDSRHKHDAADHDKSPHPGYVRSKGLPTAVHESITYVKW